MFISRHYITTSTQHHSQVHSKKMVNSKLCNSEVKFLSQPPWINTVLNEREGTATDSSDWSCQLTSARCVSLLSRACLLSLLSLVIKLLRLLNMYSKFSTPSTTFMSQDDSNVIRCSIELYKCLENECSIKSVVKWSTQSNSSLSWITNTKTHKNMENI
jgi:hypothetical protein